MADDPVGEDDVDELVDLFRGLDEWLSRGGFLPDAWKRRG